MPTYKPAMQLAQMIECLRTSPPSFLPNASGPGLSILPGTPRYAMDAQAVADYRALISQLAVTVSAADLIAAQAALAEQLRVGDYAASGGPGYAE